MSTSKSCPTCHKQWAGTFKFCPEDGSLLNAVDIVASLAAKAPAMAASPHGAGAAAMGSAPLSRSPEAPTLVTAAVPAAARLPDARDGRDARGAAPTTNKSKRGGQRLLNLEPISLNDAITDERKATPIIEPAVIDAHPASAPSPSAIKRRTPPGPPPADDALAAFSARLAAAEGLASARLSSAPAEGLASARLPSAPAEGLASARLSPAPAEGLVSAPALAPSRALAPTVAATPSVVSGRELGLRTAPTVVTASVAESLVVDSRSKLARPIERDLEATEHDSVIIDASLPAVTVTPPPPAAEPVTRSEASAPSPRATQPRVVANRGLKRDERGASAEGKRSRADKAEARTDHQRPSAEIAASKVKKGGAAAAGAKAATSGRKRDVFSETDWFMRPDLAVDPETGRVRVDPAAYVRDESIPEEERRRFSLRRKDEG